MYVCVYIYIYIYIIIHSEAPWVMTAERTSTSRTPDGFPSGSMR